MRVVVIDSWTTVGMVGFCFQVVCSRLCIWSLRLKKAMIPGGARVFRVSNRFFSGCFQVGQALDVVAERHHRHPKVGSRLPDRTNRFATHPSDCRKYILVPSPHLGDSVITPLLAFGEPAPRGSPSLNLGSISTKPSDPTPALGWDSPGQRKPPNWCWFH